jgi:hypothetical protein
MKNIVASGFFWVTLFLAEEEKVTGSKGFESKTISGHRAVRWCAACFSILKYREGNALHPIILQIKQVDCTCSWQCQTQLACMLIDPLNLTNN